MRKKKKERNPLRKIHCSGEKKTRFSINNKNKKKRAKKIAKLNEKKFLKPLHL